MENKIKLEDMTLREILELKEGYRIRVAEALNAIYSEIAKKYELGTVVVSANTETIRDYLESERFEVIYESKYVESNIKIKFSKEDD